MNVVIAPPKRDLKREAILSIALQVFLKEGYAAASMSTIAARLGGSKGTLYNYFRSKGDLFAAVIQNQTDLYQDQLFDVQDQDLRSYLVELGRRFARLMIGEDVIALHRIVVAEAVRFPEIGQALYEAGPKRGRKRLEVYFCKAMEEGRMKPGDPERAAEQAIELCLAGLYRRRLWNVGPVPTEEEIEANVQAGVSTFMAAYGAEAPSK